MSMISLLQILFFTLILFRLVSMLISARNEKKLKALGAIEHGRLNSTLLIIGHSLFYILCLWEVSGNLNFNSAVAKSGLILYGFSIIMLYTVIFKIAHIWTVKLLIAPTSIHRIDKGWLFSTFRHPNYYLNVIPELIGLAVSLQAWYTLLVLFPLQLIPLIIRIRTEEKLMRSHFKDYP